MAIPIRILIADDHPLIRESISRVLEFEHDLNIVGKAPDGLVAVEMANTLNPDIVVMDYDMPHMNGADATRQILTNNPRIVVIGLSMHDDGRVPEDMLNAGVSAYLLKGRDFGELIAVIRRFLSQGDPESTVGPER